MGDIKIHSATIHEHIFRLTDIIKLLKKANLKIQSDKCEIPRKENAYLEHLMRQDGVKPSPAKLHCIQKCPDLTTSKRH